MNAPDISVAELRSALSRLLDVVQGTFGADIALPDDHYWNVPLGSSTALHREPPLDVGSTPDDVDSVREFLSRDADEPTSIWHEADHLAGLLRSIARLDLARSLLR